MLKKFPRPEDKWYCIDCIQHKEALKEEDEKYFHCWATISYGFKLNLIFYNFSENSNGKYY